MRVFTVFCLVILCAAAFAQTPGTCELGSATGELDADGSEVYARVFNAGNLFFGAETVSGNGYLVPRLGLPPSREASSSIFASGLWVGGIVGGELRVAGARYTRFEMWPGPLLDGAVLPNPADCSAYDRIFVVSRDDVRNYLETGLGTEDLLDWPVSWGAPVLDGDGIEGNYNLEGGDQPAIYGDQTAWWVMNDVGNVHEETGSSPLGVEVQVAAFAVGGETLALKQATFYRYRIINRNTLPIDSLRISLYTDLGTGNWGDDWVGSDTTMALGFQYSRGAFDSDYGVPPATGFKIVQGPIALPNGRDDDQDGFVDESGERSGMSAFTYWCNGCTEPALTDPRTSQEYYNHMRGRWKDGTPFTAAGQGYDTEGPVTPFVFSGDPVTEECWSGPNDCMGGEAYTGYHRVVISTGPARLSPGESTELVIAIPFAQGRDNFDSVTNLRFAAQSVQAAWDTGFLAPRRVEAEPVPETFHLQISAPFPNPFTNHTAIRYELPEAMRVRMTVYDALGREVAVLVDGEQQGGSYEVDFNGANLVPGTYVVRFEAAGEERAFTMVKLR